jgi:trehalose 6-phosphate synthase
MTTIVVSNRVVDVSDRGTTQGGLAAALLAAVQKSGAMWVGGSGKFAPRNGEHCAMSAQPLGAGSLVTVDFPSAEYRRFYNGMANAVLWPVLHDRIDLIQYEAAFFESYARINQDMADAVSRVTAPETPIWVHDYHYFMLGKFLRQRCVTGPIGFFLHTPFPTRSVVVSMPSHRELFRSLAAYDLIGFQTDEDLLRFRDYVTNELFATMISQTELRLGDHRVRLGVFPIGIDVDSFVAAAPITARSPKLSRLRRGLQDTGLVIGVDRLDYSKGLSQRFLSYQRLLTMYPELRRRVSFLQIAPTTRVDVEAYRRVRDELAALSGDINARFSDADWTPLRYTNTSYSHDMLAGYYRLSRVGCVTPLRDGMNLVAKEYVASQDPDDPGVLVLSKFAGAAKELTAALIVNPYDTEEVARALHQGLQMPRDERIERWAAMMQRLRSTGVDAWFESFIATLQQAPAQTASIEARRVA